MKVLVDPGHLEGEQVGQDHVFKVTRTSPVAQTQLGPTKAIVYSFYLLIIFPLKSNTGLELHVCR